MKFWQFVWKHKTKVAGAITVATGAVQTQLPLLKPFISELTFALATVALGVVVMVLGFLNNPSPPEA
jgi:hypothetical protein